MRLEDIVNNRFGSHLKTSVRALTTPSVFPIDVIDGGEISLYLIRHDLLLSSHTKIESLHLSISTSLLHIIL
jgi:hypothetical protein